MNNSLLVRNCSVLDTNGMVSHKLGGSFEVSHEARAVITKTARPLNARTLKLSGRAWCVTMGYNMVRLFIVTVKLADASRLETFEEQDARQMRELVCGAAKVEIVSTPSFLYGAGGYRLR
jgi:hypothetical protein